MARLRAAGQTDQDLERASAEGRLPTLAVELALGEQDLFTLTHVARESGLPRDFLRELMQAAGRPNPAPREKAFTEQDLETARLVKLFLDAGLPRDELLEVSRVLSQGMAQTADAVQRLVGNALLRPGDSEWAVGLRYAEAAEQLAPLVPRLLEHQFLSHLRDGIRGAMITEAEREAGNLSGTREVAIAFADLVGYTRLGEQLPAEDLGRIAGRLSRLARAVSRRPVQLVKMIGDAAMFMSPEVPTLIDALVALRSHVEAQDGDLPTLRLRVGIAWGPATTRGGDWFGSTVNVASRITDLANPGRILVTEAVAEASEGHPWRRRRRRNLKGVEGRTRLYSLDAKLAKADEVDEEESSS